MITDSQRIRVLIVDDSAIVRKMLTQLLSEAPDIEVIGSAPDASIARQKILKLKPDVVTLDIEMPGMNGLEFLKRLMRYHPTPVIVVSSLGQAGCEIAIEALRIGATDVLPKPGGPYSVGDLRELLIYHVRAAGRARLLPRPAQSPPSEPIAVDTVASDTVIAIGASTGGTEAISAILSRMPANSPGILVVQHIPPVFSESFAIRLNSMCTLRVRQARHLDELLPGTVLVAPGGCHMVLTECKGRYLVELNTDPPVHYHRPSVDILFSSVALAAGRYAVGILLTGMGFDGAQGLLEMRRAGAPTVAQDEASCVVYGMPRRAIEVGAVDNGTHLSNIPSTLARMLTRSGKRAPVQS